LVLDGLFLSQPSKPMTEVHFHLAVTLERFHWSQKAGSFQTWEQ
jgi:hypothetical protein